MSNPARITLPQVLALMAIWAAVIYGLTIKSPPDVEQISLKGRSVACTKAG